ncbi:MAG: nucleotide-binding domain containing protein, partial [Chloroflexota bacterium]|nr:nucleotide-binding domain containing protein [Chloroflexota bacterium]
IFIPFFIEGGRYTLGNVQYAREGQSLVPVAETPFAKDTAFGYKSSNLTEWMEEKYEGRVKAEDISTISIEDIRLGGPSKVQQLLEELRRGEICIVNAADMRDLDVVALAVLRTERLGKRFLFRTSASFVRSRIAQGEQRMLTREEIASSDEGGALILVGSHVEGSTLQLEKLLDLPGMNGIELDVLRVIDGTSGLIRSIINQVEEHLLRSEDVTIYTSRELVTGESTEEYLRIGAAVTDVMSAVVAGISVKPRYLVSKGGMTSSNVAKNGLNIKRALVPGQIFPGVLVLQMGSEAKYPGTRFILFPGNVGDPDAIVDVVRKMYPSDAGV